MTAPANRTAKPTSHPFMDYDLGFLDQEQGGVEPALNPFAPEKVSTM